MSSDLQFPNTYIFTFLLNDTEKQELEDGLDEVDALRYKIEEAEIGLTRIPKKARVKYEMRKLKFHTEDVDMVEAFMQQAEAKVDVEVTEVAGRKRKAGIVKVKKKERRSTFNEDGDEVIELSSSEEETHDSGGDKGEILEGPRKKLKSADGTSSPAPIGNEQVVIKVQDDFQVTSVPNDSDIFKVLRADWYFDSVKAGILLPMERYLIYSGRRFKDPPKFHSSDVLTRAAADSEGQPKHDYSPHYRHEQKISHTRPTLLTKTTSENDDPDHFPPLPEYLKLPYSCQRHTPLHTPNDEYISQLKSIKLKRLLEGDDIGVVAYGTAIASISSYPYTLTSPSEIIRLLGCDQKIAHCFHQYQNHDIIDEARDFEHDPRMKILRLFHNIWGVGSVTAREFYDKYEWRDLDDVVIYGWKKLSRVQQIGVKYYEEFLLPIPREEVEGIARIIHEEAREIDPGFQMIIVGGYRRGKRDNMDVDVMLTHPDEEKTSHVLPELIERLEDKGWVTNVLLESVTNSERGQRPLEILGEKKKKKGFDSLDKGLVVWQDINISSSSLSISKSPSLPPSRSDAEAIPAPKNTNPHRRVDIIITPWKTAGVAIVGWSGDTTFQRDLRKYFKKEKGWKFDSSGVREIGRGEWVDLEGEGKREERGERDWEGVLLEKEKKVFEGAGSVWREPRERCTG